MTKLYAFLSALLIIFSSHMPLSAGRCNCNQGCDAFITQDVPSDFNEASQLCTLACSRYLGWNGEWSNATQGSPYCSLGSDIVGYQGGSSVETGGMEAPVLYI